MLKHWSHAAEACRHQGRVRYHRGRMIFCRKASGGRVLGQRRGSKESAHLGSLPCPSWKEGAAIIDSSKKLSTGFAKVLSGPAKGIRTERLIV